MTVDKIKLLKVSPPSYLKELSIKNEEIYLACLVDDNPKKCVTRERLSSIPNKLDSVVEDSLEVTGSPLEVDLQGDISFIYCPKIKTFNFWTEEEAKYLPLGVSKARQYINHHNRQRQSVEVPQYEDIPIFLVCDGKNPTHTVLLGAHKRRHSLMTCKVDIMGYLSTEHELLSAKHIEHLHTLNTGTNDSKTAIVTNFKYYMYGTYIQNIKNIYDSEYFGSVCIEVKCNTKTIVESPIHLVNNKSMILQVIVGHPSSPVNFLWQDLCLLQSYLDILNSPDKCNDPETAISSSHCDPSDINKSITGIVKATVLKRETKGKFDLENIRLENSLDKLWNILKSCNNLSTLRNCFHNFFEELAEPEVTIKIPDKSSANVIEIINGILEGKLAVPTITYAQALTFLFELGAEKLKNDYLAINKNFYCISEGVILEKWNQLQSTLKLQDGVRKTRITVGLKSGKIDVTQHISKLAYLGKLHLVAEMIYLVKEEVCLPDETFDYLCERIYEAYIGKDIISDFIDLKNSPRCEFAFSVDLEDNIIKNDIPETWTIQMKSATNRNLEVTTLYHLSKFKIFPPTIYDNYGLDDVVENNSKSFYVCKLEMFTEII